MEVRKNEGNGRMNILKVVMSLLVIAILMIGLSFAAFMVYENTIAKKDDVSTNVNDHNKTVEENTSLNNEQITEDNNEQSAEKPEYLHHYLDKTYALRLMSYNRDSIPEGSKELEEYDTTIETARTNIANGLGAEFDYKIVAQHEAINSVGGNQGKTNEKVYNKAKPIDEMTQDEYDKYLLTQKRAYLTTEQQKRYDELLIKKQSTPGENDDKNAAYNMEQQQKQQDNNSNQNIAE
ncbi:hypothetical protein [Mammaliicoccus sciuri]|uniref:hypothetical protein n=1 Tax=Mammaliicoccus sciuri TaxID=1296 RepID=UPI001FB494CC|nr:hypothetical protein [Mammaliicoccus sciuri]MCJ0918728.1 hypothetical protein [Mammaliicoccus sciuri]MCJ0961252.1 hypothetical protein [Mammaliicoccus sciuri]